MKKELIIFGVSGDLGSEAANVFIHKDYDKYYFFGKKVTGKNQIENVKYFEIEDLSLEENVKRAFQNIETNKDSNFYLLSTIGGYISTGSVSETNLNDLNYMINKNFITSFLIARYFTKIVKQSHRGSICFISSINAEVPLKDNFAYALSKHSLNYLINSLAKEGREANFSVNGIAPGVLDTSKNRDWIKEGTEVVSLTDLAELVDDIFQNHGSLTGNIIEMPGNKVYY